MIALVQKFVVVFLGAILLLMAPSCNKDSYSVKLAGSTTIGEEWTVLQPTSPLKAEKTFQWVLLDLEPPLKDDMYNEGKGPLSGKGILMPDRSVVNPEIYVIDQSGNEFSLVYGGSKGGPIYGSSWPNQLPRDREYKLVKLRSATPIKCKGIYWYLESSKDWK